MRRALSLTTLLPALLAMQADPKITEVRIDSLPPRPNLEYIEITGVPGASLDGLALVVIGDEGDVFGAPLGNSGVIETVISLDGHAVPQDHVFIICDDDMLPFAADLHAATRLEDSDNLTVLLVRGSTAVQGEDLDIDDDGVLDTQPWKQRIDGVAFVWTPPGGVSEYVYDRDVVTPLGISVSFGGRRCLDLDRWEPLDGYFPNATETPGTINRACGGVLCSGDLTDDFQVGSADLALVLSNWGELGTRADVNLDGLVDAQDLTSLLMAWGPCDL